MASFSHRKPGLVAMRAVVTLQTIPSRYFFSRFNSASIRSRSVLAFLLSG